MVLHDWLTKQIRVDIPCREGKQSKRNLSVTEGKSNYNYDVMHKMTGFMKVK